MISFTKYIDLLSSQKRLYFLLLLLFLIPNFVLLVTESLPVFAALASIFLPLALGMGLLLFFRKPGIPILILFPKIFIDGGQLVLLHLFGESVISVDMFLNLTSSNASEASELLGNIFIVIISVFLLYTLPTIILSIYSIRIKDKLSDQFRLKQLKVMLITFVAGVLMGGASLLQGYTLSLKNDVYPLNVIYNLYFAINKAEKNANYTTTSANFTFQATKSQQAPNNREVYVLVVGETSRAMEWSLYGYERKTTPRMEELEGLVCFKDAVTQSNNTHKSVPIILSAASAENYEILYQQKSIVTAYKEAGFRTVVIANQKLTTSMIGEFYREADTFIDMSSFKTGSYLASLHDGAILPYLEEELKKTEGNLFIVLHTYGSHFNYKERYPKEFMTFTPDKVLGIRESNKVEMHNAYDNSILYTDYVLGEIVSLLKKTETCASMLYLSDHGEDLFDDSRKRYLHASPIPTYYQLHIPYVIWFSDVYRDVYPEKYMTTLANSSMPVSTNSVFHTILDISGINTPIADKSYALSNSSFHQRDRMYMGDHDNPVPFWEIGLKTQDFEMLDKWNIDYRKN